MIRFRRSKVIDASPQNVWVTLARYMHIDDFAPEVISVEALSDATTGVGAKRRCHFRNGGSLAEEVIRWDEMRGYRMRLSEMDPMPLKRAEGWIAIKALGPNRTQVDWGLDYAMKYGPLGWVMGQTMLKLVMGKVISGNLTALADFLRTRGAGSAQTA